MAHLTHADINEIKRQVRRWSTETSIDGRYQYEIVERFDDNDETTFVADDWADQSDVAEYYPLNEMRGTLERTSTLRIQVQVYEMYPPSLARHYGTSRGDLLDQVMVEHLGASMWTANPETVSQTW